MNNNDWAIKYDYLDELKGRLLRCESNLKLLLNLRVTTAHDFIDQINVCNMDIQCLKNQIKEESNETKISKN